ncbi:hypothetical protein [Microbacterium ureisolvens]|uniref:DUF2357 domain-containing protein n=1 Tax=Microbacterium ureisolvens TaxID=2781186 RepID=A0ABS7I0L7_9MICO|nr:hypothetical protein [Microbacterium ureisolvens]MBW9110644.1 hypothetical protein [Microbacterium ureisolvens]
MADKAHSGASVGDAPELTETAQKLKDRCDAAGLKVLFRVMDRGEDWEQLVAVVEFPEGRSTRRVTIEDDEFEVLLDSDFESVRFLGDYAAFTDKSGTIEAALPPQGRPAFRLRNLPGVVVSVGDSEEENDEFSFLRRITWQLEIPDPNSSVALELGSVSALGGALLPTSTSLRVKGLPPSSHDEALENLETYANRLSFDLDVVFGASFRIPRRRRARRNNREDASQAAVRFPRNAYAMEPLQLYHYGREADGLPLLEFLAYYQAVEYFFPFFAREQMMNDVRATLKNPAFDPNDDRQVGRLINLTGQVRGVQTERDQLRTTIRSCLAPADLREFLESDQERLSALTAKKQPIRGVKAVRMDEVGEELRDQLSDRIYTIRCRIVHSKQDGGGYEEVLLPGTREADALHPDIDVLQFVAQRVLIARAARA